MGNKLAADFKGVKLGVGHMTAANAGRNSIVPDAVVLDSNMAIAVQKDPKNRSIQFFEVATQKRLFITTMTKSETMGSITKDARGNILFITKAPDKSTRIILKVSEQFDREITSEPSSIEEDEDEMTPVAKIEVDNVGSCITAFLSVRYKKRSRHRGDGSTASGSMDSASRNTGTDTKHSVASGSKSGGMMSTDFSTDPIFVDVYKAVKIPTVKYGAVIVDMRGQVVGKAQQSKNDPLPVVNVAPGADASAVAALACIVNGDL